MGMGESLMESAQGVNPPPPDPKIGHLPANTRQQVIPKDL